MTKDFNHFFTFDSRAYFASFLLFLFKSHVLIFSVLECSQVLEQLKSKYRHLHLQSVGTWKVWVINVCMQFWTPEHVNGDILWAPLSESHTQWVKVLITLLPLDSLTHLSIMFITATVSTGELVLGLSSIS